MELLVQNNRTSIRYIRRHERVSEVKYSVYYILYIRWQDNTNTPAYRQASIASADDEKDKKDKKQNSRKKSIFDQEAIKLAPQTRASTMYTVLQFGH